MSTSPLNRNNTPYFFRGIFEVLLLLLHSFRFELRSVWLAVQTCSLSLAGTQQPRSIKLPARGRTLQLPANPLCMYYMPV